MTDEMQDVPDEIGETEDEGPFPLTALVAVVWSFHGGEPFADAAEFNRRVSEYHVQVTGEDTWDPAEAVMPLPRIRVQYFGIESPEDDEYTDFVLDLQADDGAGFTAGELLLKLHNAVAPRQARADHCFIERLYLTEEVGAAGVPVYEMMQGS